MALHDDLLEQAEHLAGRERRRPKQASLRRAVSSAYYAMFHKLVDESTRRLMPRKPPNLRLQVARAFVHADMKVVCKGFATGRVASLKGATGRLIAEPLEPQLILMAATFIELQEARHKADYDLLAAFTRIDALNLIGNVRQAFAAWGKVRYAPNAFVFLGALLLERNWSK